MRAPIPDADLRSVLNDDLSQARTLPAAAYISDDLLSWERQFAFGRGWMCLGRGSDYEVPGDQIAISAGLQSVLLIRGQDGVLAAFHNVCRHRGHELLSCGQLVNRAAVRCPYHSWVYNLDGSLRAASRFLDTENFNAGEWPLIPIRCAEWNGWVFVNVSGAGPAFPGWAGNLDDILAPYSLGSMRVAAAHNYVVQANWKTIVENYLECYHCPTIHPELCRVSPPDSAQAFASSGYWIGGPMELRDRAETMSLDGSGRSPLPGLSDHARRNVCYFVLPPNLLISAHPDYVMTHRLSPLSPNQTSVECSWLFPAEAVTEEGFDPSYAADFWDITNRQDFTACESVARGLTSPGYRPGPFDAREDGVRAFQEQIARLYMTGQWQRARGALMGRDQATLSAS